MLLGDRNCRSPALYGWFWSRMAQPGIGIQGSRRGAAFRHFLVPLWESRKADIPETWGAVCWPLHCSPLRMSMTGHFLTIEIDIPYPITSLDCDIISEVIRILEHTIELLKLHGIRVEVAGEFIEGWKARVESS